MKTTLNYEIAFRGSKTDMLNFEKLLNSMMVSIEQMQAWYDVNDEENPPTGVVHWLKYKHLKSSNFLFKEKDRVKIK